MVQISSHISRARGSETETPQDLAKSTITSGACGA